MKTDLIMTLLILSVNLSDGISQGFEIKSGKSSVSYYTNSRIPANRFCSNGFSGIFNSVYYPGTGVGSPEIKSQSCTGNITGIYESADAQTHAISERTETFSDSAQSSVNRSKVETIRNKVMKRKDMVNGRK